MCGVGRLMKGKGRRGGDGNRGVLYDMYDGVNVLKGRYKTMYNTVDDILAGISACMLSFRVGTIERRWRVSLTWNCG